MIPKRPFGRSYSSGRWILASAFLLAAIAQIHVSPSTAQPSAFWSPNVAHPGERISLFTDWDDRVQADGLIIRTDAGWDVLDVRAIATSRSGGSDYSLHHVDGEVIAQPFRTLSGRHRIAITLRAPDRLGPSNIEVTPSVYRQDLTGSWHEPQDRLRFDFDLQIEESPPSAGRSLRLAEGRLEAPHLDSARERNFTDGEGFTVSVWFKTVDRDKVVVTSWDGTEGNDYPFELFIDAGGELRAFSSHRGMHYSLGSQAPVADGTWHHAAYAVDFESGIASLVLDGDEIDSRFLPDLRTDSPSTLSIGGRPRSSEVCEGLIDELVIWPSSRPPVEIARLARIPSTGLDLSNGGIAFGFDDLRQVRRLTGIDESDLVSSDLALHQPASDVVAELRPGSVLIDWVIEHPEPQVMTVERSTDGLTFEAIYFSRIEQSDVGHLSAVQIFEFEDIASESSSVSFYRITQVFADETTIKSGVIKVGIGAVETPSAIELVGNSPNPFAHTTEIYFRVKEPTPMRLSVWSVSGHLIEVLVSESRERGLYRIPFEAHDLPSGTYFLRLESDEGVQTKKMIVRR